MRIIWLSILVAFCFVPTAFAQRDAPVWESYLPKVAIYHDETDKRSALTLDFLFKKHGGPVEHTEHQAYVLVYLKKDEDEIMKLIGDPELIKKKNEKTKLFLDLLVEKKLVVPLDSQVAKLNQENKPRYGDVRGNPNRAGADTITDFTFPFKFTFTCETLFQSVQKLGHFDMKNANVYGKETWFEDRFKLIVFVPVNDSAYATKVSAKLREMYDFANPMDFKTSLLYFRPLPYEFNFKKYEEDTLLIYIN